MNSWNYEPAADLDQSLVERLRNFPREPDMTVYGLRILAALTARAWLRTYHRFSVSGRENLPREGSFVMVANHASHLDALCLLSALPLGQLHRAFPAAAQDFFFVNVPRLAVVAVVMNALPFSRQTHIRQSLNLCRQLLANPGNVLILFPEGTRTTTGEMGPFKPGVGLLVAGTTVPVIPCYVSGAFAAWPKGRRLPRPHRLQLRIGAPRSYPALTPGRDAAENISLDLHQAVANLMG